MTEIGVEPEAPAESRESKERKREQKRLEDANRPLDSWERYRALNDTMDEAYELVQSAAANAWDDGTDFRDELASNPDVTSRIALDGLFDPRRALRNLDVVFDRLEKVAVRER